MSDSRITLPPKNWCYTQVKVIKCRYMWTINNYSFCRQKSGECLESSTFSDAAFDNLKWRLRIYPTHYDIYQAYYVSLHLVLVSCDKSVEVNYKLCVLNAKREETNAKVSRESIDVCKGSVLEEPYFIERDFLLNEANGLLPEDTLTILCEVYVLPVINNISGQSIVQLTKCKLIEDFGNLFDNEKFSDVTLAVGERKFHAHKAILAARSDVFAAMFEHEMEERKSNRVTITDVDHEVLKELLRFIYTGKAPNVVKMAHGLLAAADKYALGYLKEMCEEALSVNLSIETAAETLILADLHNANQLKVQTINFIKAHVTNVMKTQGWQNMFTTHLHLHLIAEAFQAIAS